MAKERLIIPFYVSHAGCPQMCIFCNQGKISGRKTAMPAPETIPLTIRKYLDSWNGNGIKEAAFFGGSFTSIDKYEQEMLLGRVYPFIESGEIDYARVSTRPDAIDDEGLQLLGNYGVRVIELGVQSMDDTVLAASQRGHTASDTVTASTLIRGKGFSLGCQLMPGLPGESREKMISGAHAVASLRPDFVRIYPAVVIHGTRMADIYRSGDYNPLDLNEAVEICGEMVDLFRDRGIDVIRVGLQHTDELEKSVVGGPYHPAFGEMVESFILLKKARKLLEGRVSEDSAVCFSISPKDESAFRGQRSRNVKKLKELFPCFSFDILKVDGMSRGTVLIS